MATPRNARPGMLLDPGAPINSGLVGWWPMWEGAGGKTLDISGKNNHGTLTNGPKWAGRGLIFDGTDDCALYDIANFRSSDNTGSIVVRFKSTSTAIVKTFFSSADAGSINDYLGLFLNPPGAVGSIYVQTNVAGVTTSVRTTATTFNDGVEHTAILTSNGSAWSIIVDGVNQALTVISGSNNGTWFADISNRDNISIGSLKRSSNVSFFEGTIFGVRVFSREISIPEAQQLHVAPNFGLWVPDTIRYYIPAAGASGTGVILLRPLAVSGAGKVIFKGTGAPSLAALAVSGAAKERLTATGAANLSPMTVSGAGKERFTATGTISLSPMTASTSGKEILTATGALTLRPLSVSGAGSHTAAGVTSGSGAVSLAGLQVSGVGKVILRGTGTVSLSPAGVSATGKELFTATGNVTLAALTASGAAKEAFKGVGAVSLAPFTAAGIGKEILRGTASMTLRSLNVAGAGTGGSTPAATYAIEIVVNADARDIVVLADPRNIVVN